MDESSKDGDPRLQLPYLGSVRHAVIMTEWRFGWCFKFATLFLWQIVIAAECIMKYVERSLASPIYSDSLH
jgi:hypothetical protein